MGGRRTRPVLAAILGLLFGIVVAADLLYFGAVKLNSPVLTFLPVVCLVVFPVLAVVIGRTAKTTATPSAPVAAPTTPVEPVPVPVTADADAAGADEPTAPASPTDDA